MRFTGEMIQKAYYTVTCIALVILSICAIWLLVMTLYTVCAVPAILAVILFARVGTCLPGLKYLRYTYEMNEQGVCLKDHAGVVKKKILWNDVTNVKEYPFRFNRGGYAYVYEPYILILSNGKDFQEESIFKAIKQPDVICIPKTIDAVRILCEYLHED